MRDALEVAAKTWLVELEAERVGRDVLEPVRFVDDNVLGLRQERAVHARVLQEQGVVHDDDRGVCRGVARALQIAVHARHALAATLVARLVARRNSRPKLALATHEIQLRAVSGFGRGAPDEGLADDARFLAICDRAPQYLPAPRTQVVRPAFQHGDRDVGAERGLQRGQILPHELVLQGKRVRRDDHALPHLSRCESRHRIRHRLADACAGLGHERAAVRERSLDRHGELALLLTVLVSRE